MVTPPKLARVLLHELLNRRSRIDGSAPFLTTYQSDQRTELSVRSFANWVAKTANLMTDDLGLDPGDRVELRLAGQHPGHWMTLVWTMAVWQAGLCVTDTDGDLVVEGPEPGPTTGTPGFACSLHPLGLGLRDLPEGWSDFSTTALAQPDAWFGTGPDSPDDQAWERDGRSLTFAELTEAVPPSDARVLLVDPDDPWDAAARCLIAPLRGSGSSVVAIGADDTHLARIRDSEKVDR